MSLNNGKIANPIKVHIHRSLKSQNMSFNLMSAYMPANKNPTFDTIRLNKKPTIKQSIAANANPFKYPAYLILLPFLSSKFLTFKKI